MSANNQIPLGNVDDMIRYANAQKIASVETSPAASGANQDADFKALNAAIDKGLVKQEQKYAALFDERKRLGAFVPAPPDNQNPNAIFNTKYLRRGQTLLFVSILGLGKSTLVSQASECWALGKSFYGITPARPLSIGVFETEDDDDEIADFRDNFRKGFQESGEWTADEIAQAENGNNAPIYYSMSERLTSINFLKYLEYCVSHAEPKHDLIIINPFYDFLGDDMSKGAVVQEWKSKLDQLAANYNFAVLLVHHTNKVPSSKKERDEWCGGASAAYAGSGSMVLPSSSRAIIFMRPLKNGIVALEAAKRGKRLGWTDFDGNPSTTKYLAHSEGFIYWREPSREEVNDAIAAVKQSHDEKRAKSSQEQIDKLITVCKENGKYFDTKKSFIAKVVEKYHVSETTVRDWLKKANGVIIEREILSGKVIKKCVGFAEQFNDSGEDDTTADDLFNQEPINP